MHTPWGKAQTVKIVAPGITWISTASHGGIKLDNERSVEFRKQFPDAKLFLGGSTWFEEDCDAALVAAAFPEYFPKQQTMGLYHSLWFSHKQYPDVERFLTQFLAKEEGRLTCG